MSGSNLSNTDLSMAVFQGANLAGSRFLNSKVSISILEAKILSGSQYNSSTVLPAELLLERYRLVETDHTIDMIMRVDPSIDSRIIEHLENDDRLRSKSITFQNNIEIISTPESDTILILEPKSLITIISFSLILPFLRKKAI